MEEYVIVRSPDWTPLGFLQNKQLVSMHKTIKIWSSSYLEVKCSNPSPSWARIHIMLCICGVLIFRNVWFTAISSVLCLFKSGQFSCVLCAMTHSLPLLTSVLGNRDLRHSLPQRSKLLKLRPKLAAFWLVVQLYNYVDCLSHPFTPPRQAALMLELHWEKLCLKYWF